MAKKNKTKRTQSKKQPPQPKQTTLKNHYDMIYLAIGLVLFFVSILSLFDGGFIGVLFSNSIRLLVGESYTLLLFSIGLWGAYLIIKGQLPRIGFWKYFGAGLILIALTTVLHFNTFNGIEPTAIFGRTYEMFRNDLMMSQNRSDLGGGMLGALLYSAFGYLFGRWGTYLFSTVIFIIGFCLVESISIRMVKDVSLVFVQSFFTLFRKLFPNWSEMKEVFNQRDEDEYEEDYFEEVGDPDLNYEFESERPKVIRSSRFETKATKASLLGKLFNRAEVEQSQEHRGFETSDYQPSYRPNERKAFDTFDTRRQPTVNRIVREEKILDLDYFDQQQGNMTPPVTHKPVIETSVPINSSLASPVQEMREEEIATPMIEKQPIGDSDLAAGHWQSHAAESQNLMHDAIDDVLNQVAEGEKILTKPVKPKRGKKLQLPGKSLLKKIPPVDQSEEYARINENIEKLERTFASFGVKAKVVKANLGPTVTKYEIEPAIGVKVSKIVSLSDDIALALAARDVRMEAPIPGKSLIGIEVPNTQVSPVSFWEIIDAALESKNLLDVPLGRDISGSVCLADLSKMPHLLIAGATGSGKSVGMNVIIASLLMKVQPDEVKFLMIDPKKVELTMYDDLPHQLAPVVTNPRKAAQALNKVVQEMERRYELFAASNVRNIDNYNEQVDEWNKESHDTVYEKLPKIIVFVDELADLMMVASNEVENAIIRLAQMARAAGIHMIIATQRPSVDVITGIIKANVPSRLAFAVSSGTDSRTILDSIGAEKLLGRGDMLFQPMGKNKPVRVQGAYISDSEVERITNYIKDQQVADYEESLIVLDEENESGASVSEDEYFDEAVEMLQGLETISISQLQRKFRIGYNRAARLIDDMEAAGLVGGQDGSKPRQVL